MRRQPSRRRHRTRRSRCHRWSCRPPSRPRRRVAPRSARRPWPRSWLHSSLRARQRTAGRPCGACRRQSSRTGPRRPARARRGRSAGPASHARPVYSTRAGKATTTTTTTTNPYEWHTTRGHLRATLLDAGRPVRRRPQRDAASRATTVGRREWKRSDLTRRRLSSPLVIVW